MQPVFVIPKPTEECVPVMISCDIRSNSVSIIIIVIIIIIWLIMWVRKVH